MLDSGKDDEVRDDYQTSILSSECTGQCQVGHADLVGVGLVCIQPHLALESYTAMLLDTAIGPVYRAGFNSIAIGAEPL